MSIFTEIKASLYSPDYYKEVPQEKLSSSFSYLISLTLFVSLAVTTILCFRLLPIAKTSINNFGPEVVKRFPESLVITIKGGRISTNSEEPVIIPLRIGSSTLGIPDNLIVIDTKNPYNEGRFREAHTLFYVSDDAIYAGTDKGEIQRFEQTNIPDTTIDRAMIVGWLGELTPLLSWIPFILVVTVFFISFSVSTLVIFELVLTALLIMFLSKYRGISLSYKQSYQVGLHLATARVLLDILVASFPILFLPIVSIPFFTTILILILFWINFPPTPFSQQKINEAPVQ